MGVLGEGRGPERVETELPSRPALPALPAPRSVPPLLAPFPPFPPATSVAPSVGGSISSTSSIPSSSDSPPVRPSSAALSGLSFLGSAPSPRLPCAALLPLPLPSPHLNACTNARSCACAGPGSSSSTWSTLHPTDPLSSEPLRRLLWCVLCYLPLALVISRGSARLAFLVSTQTLLPLLGHLCSLQGGWSLRVFLLVLVLFPTCEGSTGAHSAQVMHTITQSTHTHTAHVQTHPTGKRMPTCLPVPST